MQLLEELDLRYNAIDDDGAICVLKSLKKLRHVTHLDLSWNLLTSGYIAASADLIPECRHLKSYYIHGNSFGETGIIDVCDQMVRNVTIEDLKIGWSDAKVNHKQFSILTGWSKRNVIYQGIFLLYFAYPTQDPRRWVYC